ncbi:antA/AntB antirepressor family protein [Rodentibacter abscessus]|uniref:antA/AntB antirepressor family protein n=1 Tax=Rodentibacter abscessus TaxID=3381777 RepID=UPI00399CBA9E
MTNLSIKTFNGSIQNQPTLLINARDLHKALQSKQHFSDWIKSRLNVRGLQENVDFIGVQTIMITESGFFGKREKTVKDYHLTLDTAKHLCLMENSEIGYQIRQQFIENDNKARAELPRLKQQLMAIPAFLRNNPNEIARLQKQARQALFTAYPECEKIILYREMGLENSEISKLLDLGRKALELRLRKLFDLGLLQRRQTVRQLALFV